MFLPEDMGIRWDRSMLEIAGQNGKVINRSQIDGMQKLFISLRNIYEEIVRAHNIGAYRVHGDATIASNDTEIEVFHNLPKKPLAREVHVHPISKPQNKIDWWWVPEEAVGAESFKIMLSGPPGGSGVRFAWEVHLDEGGEA